MQPALDCLRRALCLIALTIPFGALAQTVPCSRFDLLADAWLTFKQVRDCADAATHPPGQDISERSTPEWKLPLEIPLRAQGIAIARGAR
jgi:hypothetical protein